MPADQRFTHWGSTPLLLLMGNVVYYVMGPSDRHIITSMSELYHMERAFQSNNKLCGGNNWPPITALQGSLGKTVPARKCWIY